MLVSEADGCYRVDYTLSAVSPEGSPYSYTVNGFALKGGKELKQNCEYSIEFDGPIDFSANEKAEFTLTMYIKCPDKVSAEYYAENAEFGTRGITMNFGIIKYKIQVYVPGFSIKEIL